MTPVAIIRFTLFVFATYIASLISYNKCLAEFAKNYSMAFLLYLFNIKLTIKGSENLYNQEQPEPYVCVYNHTSMFDGPFVSYIVRNSRIVMRESQKKIPFIGYIASKLDYIFIPSNSTGFISVLQNEAKNNSRNIIIAPEGMCSNGNQILKFHNGAFTLNRPVLPVIIKFPNFKPIWTVEDIRIKVWHTFCQLGFEIDVTILPIIKQLEGETVVDFSNKVRKNMSDASGLPMVEQSMQDFKELVQFRKNLKNKQIQN